MKIAAITVPWIVAVILLATGMGLTVEARELKLVETPSLIERVNAGELPPIEARLPRCSL